MSQVFVGEMVSRQSYRRQTGLNETYHFWESGWEYSLSSFRRCAQFRDYMRSRVNNSRCSSAGSDDAGIMQLRIAGSFFWRRFQSYLFPHWAEPGKNTARTGGIDRGRCKWICGGLLYWIFIISWMQVAKKWPLLNWNDVGMKDVDQSNVFSNKLSS